MRGDIRFMGITLETLRTIAFAIISPSYVMLLIVLGIIFYRKNKKTTLMQKMIIGSSVNSPLELTISQIVLGILVGALGSLLMTYFGIVFKENSAIYLIFLISLLLMFINPKLICFSYSGAILGIISIIVQYLNNLGIIKGLYIFDVNIISLMSLIGVLHIMEGVLVIIDGNKGAIPVFANRNDSIVGGFALKRHWALPIAIMFILGSSSGFIGENVPMPNWWPLLSGTIDLKIVENMMLMLVPLYAVIGYNSVTFTKSKKQKALVSGLLILIYGIILILVAQLATINRVLKIFVVLFAPLAHEGMLKIDKYMEAKGTAKYVSGEDGLMILEVAPNSPAYKMGIESGDLLVELNHKEIDLDQDVFEILRELPTCIWLKIKKSTGELKDINYNRVANEKRLGIVFVPRNLPNSTRVVKYNNEKFKEVLEKLKDKDEDNKQ